MINFIKNQFIKYKRIIKFGIIGLSGTVIDFSVLTLLVELAGFNILIANAISFIFGATNNFVWNKFWTFRNKDRKFRKQFFKYLTVAFIGLIINTALMHLFITLGLHYLIAKVVIAAIVVIWNYNGNKFWTFRQ
jgi:putative flippase GtrA